MKLNDAIKGKSRTLYFRQGGYELFNLGLVIVMRQSDAQQPTFLFKPQPLGDGQGVEVPVPYINVVGVQCLCDGLRGPAFEGERERGNALC